MCVRQPCPQKSTIWIRNYKNYKAETFVKQLQSLPWSVIEAFDDPQDMADAFVTLYSDVANLCTHDAKAHQRY